MSNIPSFTATPLRLYNTLTRLVEVFEPIAGPKVGLYACGLTVYDFTHLGHLRKYTLDDVLIRTLRTFGYDVTFVQNITDVGHLSSDADEGEDKLEKGAKKYQQSVWDIAQRFEQYFFYSMDKMGNLRPDVSCRATEHIDEQLAMVKGLEAAGYTYVIDGDGVYFDTSKDPNYGFLARLQLDKLKAGARIETVAGKRNPTDFALWKFERPGENRAMVWPSPWHERSFPGWHIECSAMSTTYLGDQFDIHTGGIDHIPVHHTNEIAQAEAATGKKPFVKYWVHHNHLHVDGQKMSKSLGNFYTIDDILERGFSPKALRLLFLGSHYRSELNFTWESLSSAQTAWEKLLSHYQGWLDDTKAQASISAVEKSAASARIEELRSKFYEAIADDLNTSSAVAALWEVVKDKDLSSGQKLNLTSEFDQILGLNFAMEATEPIAKYDQPEVMLHELPPEIAELAKARQAARQAKDWAQSDHLRDQLAAQGYAVTDSADGQQKILRQD